MVSTSSVVDRFDVVDDLRLEEQQARGAVRGARAGEEVGVARGDDAVDRELARVAVVGVQAVLLPRIVTEDHVGAGGPDHRAHLFPTVRRRPRARRRPRRGSGRRGRRARAGGCPLLVPCGWPRSAARSWSGSQVPFEPSVSTSISTWEPARAHFASVAPQPNSMSSGWAPMARTARGASASVTGHVAAELGSDGRPAPTRSSGTSTSNARSAVAHDPQPEPEPAGLRGVAAERSGSVGEPEVGCRRDREHRGAVVAVAGHQGDDRLRPVACEPGEIVRAREIGVGDDHAACTLGRAGGRDRLAAAPSSVPGSSSTSSVEVARPGAHVGIRRHHDHGHRRRGVHHLLGPPATERGALGAVERSGESGLAQRERADRDHRAGRSGRGRRRGTSVHVCYRSWGPRRPWP